MAATVNKTPVTSAPVSGTINGSAEPPLLLDDTNDPVEEADAATKRKDSGKVVEDPGTPLGDENADEEEDSDDDDVQITIGDIRTNVSFRQPARASFQPTATATAGKGQASKLDMDAVGMIGSKSVFDINFESIDDKPWRKPGADLTDYFNYGFTEETFLIYCDRQRRLREEFGSVHANRLIFAGSGPLNIMSESTKNKLQKPAQIIPPVNLMGALHHVHPTGNHPMPLPTIAAATPVPLTAATPAPMEQPPPGMLPPDDSGPPPGSPVGTQAPPPPPVSMFLAAVSQSDHSEDSPGVMVSESNNFPLTTNVKSEPGVGGGNGMGEPPPGGGLAIPITPISQPTVSMAPGSIPGSIIPPNSSSIQTLVSSVPTLGGAVLISGSGPGLFPPVQVAPPTMQFGAGPPILVATGPPLGAGAPIPSSGSGTAIPVLNSQPERINMALPPPSFAPAHLQFPPPGFNPGPGPPQHGPGQPLPGGPQPQGPPRPFPPGMPSHPGPPGGPQQHPQLHGLPPGAGIPQHGPPGGPRLMHPPHPGGPPQQNMPGMPPPGAQGMPPRSHPPPPGVHLGGPPPGFHNPNFPPPRPAVMHVGPPPNFNQQPRQFLPPGQVGIRPGWDPAMTQPERDRDRSPASYSDKSSDVEDRETSVRPRERREHYTRERDFRRESRPRGGSAERRSPSATHHRSGESSSRRHRGSDGSGHRAEREHRSGREREREASHRYRSRSPHERSSGMSRRDDSDLGPDSLVVKKEKTDEVLDQRSPEKRKKSSKRKKDGLDGDELGRSREEGAEEPSGHRSSRSKVKKEKRKTSKGGDDGSLPPGTGSLVKQEPKD